MTQYKWNPEDLMKLEGIELATLNNYFELLMSEGFEQKVQEAQRVLAALEAKKVIEGIIRRNTEDGVIKTEMVRDESNHYSKLEEGSVILGMTIGKPREKYDDVYTTEYTITDWEGVEETDGYWIPTIEKRMIEEVRNLGYTHLRWGYVNGTRHHLREFAPPLSPAESKVAGYVMFIDAYKEKV